ncbi:unnamed protein product [Cylicostephanus goldi]|uniref:Uncharacterized protein n=1 Tax=Cylicostephanus goldi TaxID=71465 RepID=A0A3P6QK33_CYLGO|nr:unnamed protein product [Cylicostephanus goldi]
MNVEWNTSNCCLVDICDFLECVHFMGPRVLVDRVKMLAILTSRKSEISNLELRVQHLEKIYHIERHTDGGSAMVESDLETEEPYAMDHEQGENESLSDRGDETDDSVTDV